MIADELREFARMMAPQDAMRPTIEKAANELDRLKRIESAAERVLAGLRQRIEAAPSDAVPVFHGIVDLRDAINSPSR